MAKKIVTKSKKTTVKKSKKPTVKTRGQRVKEKIKTTSKKVSTKVKTNVKKGTEKVKTTGKKIASGVVKGAKSPVGKLGLPAAALTTAYFVADQFRSDKRSKTRGERAGKKGPKLKLPTPSTVKKTKGPKVSDIMGGAKGPKGPLGASLDSLKTYTVDGKKIKAKNRQDAINKAKRKQKIDLRKTNLAGSKFGQRKTGGVIKKAVGGVTRQRRVRYYTRDETPMGTFYKPNYEFEKISAKMEREIDVLKRSLKKEGVTAKQKKELKKLIDAKKAGIASTKQSMFSRRPSSTIPTRTGTKEDVKTKKETEGYQTAKRILKIADKRMDRGFKKQTGGLTKINPQKQPGLAALKKKRPDVVAKMGYAKKGTMVQARGCGLARKKPTKIT